MSRLSVMAATYHAGYGWPVDDAPRETIAAVVLAAGEGRRFGGPKQLHVIDGITMLERVLIAVERSGIAARLVVLGARAEQITADVPLHGAVAVVSPRWADGQAASITRRPDRGSAAAPARPAPPAPDRRSRRSSRCRAAWPRSGSARGSRRRCRGAARSSLPHPASAAGRGRAAAGSRRPDMDQGS